MILDRVGAGVDGLAGQLLALARVSTGPPRRRLDRAAPPPPRPPRPAHCSTAAPCGSFLRLCQVRRRSEHPRARSGVGTIRSAILSSIGPVGVSVGTRKPFTCPSAVSFAQTITTSAISRYIQRFAPLITQMSPSSACICSPCAVSEPESAPAARRPRAAHPTRTAAAIRPLLRAADADRAHHETVLHADEAATLASTRASRAHRPRKTAEFEGRVSSQGIPNRPRSARPSTTLRSKNSALAPELVRHRADALLSRKTRRAAMRPSPGREEGFVAVEITGQLEGHSCSVPSAAGGVASIGSLIQCAEEVGPLVCEHCRPAGPTPGCAARSAPARRPAMDAAEAELSTHPGSPSRIAGDGVLESVSGRLPFLMKVLVPKSRSPCRPIRRPRRPRRRLRGRGGRGTVEPTRSGRDPRPRRTDLRPRDGFQVLCGFRPVEDRRGRARSAAEHGGPARWPRSGTACATRICPLSSSG